MRYGVLGTGTVGRTIAGKLTELGHEVQLGSREAGEDKVTFAEAASFGEVILNATAGTASLDALEAAGADNLSGKVLIDVANPLDFSKGMPPVLSVCNDTSLAEQIQEEFPESTVIKALNTVNVGVMVNPEVVPGSHTVFVAGNEDGAKAQVSELLESFGWPPDDVMDLGDLSAARGMEMYLPLWLRLFGATGTAQVNVKVLAAE